MSGQGLNLSFQSIQRCGALNSKSFDLESAPGDELRVATFTSHATLHYQRTFSCMKRRLSACQMTPETFPNAPERVAQTAFGLKTRGVIPRCSSMLLWSNADVCRRAFWGQEAARP